MRVILSLSSGSSDNSLKIKLPIPEIVNLRTARTRIKSMVDGVNDLADSSCSLKTLHLKSGHVTVTGASVHDLAKFARTWYNYHKLNQETLSQTLGTIKPVAATRSPKAPTIINVFDTIRKELVSYANKMKSGPYNNLAPQSKSGRSRGEYIYTGGAIRAS